MGMFIDYSVSVGITIRRNIRTMNVMIVIVDGLSFVINSFIDRMSELLVFSVKLVDG
jgi:hypothetical protein